MPQESQPPPMIDWVLDAQLDSDAAARYREAVSDVFDITLGGQGPATPFHNRLESYHVGTALIGRGRSTPQTFHRSRAAARRGDLGHLQLILETAGEVRGDYDGRDLKAGAGTIRIVDMSRPFTASSDAFDLISIVLPRTSLPAAVGDRDVHGMVLDAKAPATRLLAAHLRVLWSMIAELSREEAAAGVAAAAALFECAAKGTLALPEDCAAPVERTLLTLAKHFIAEHLGDFRLGPEAVCAHLAVSPRTLYRIFEGTGGVAGYIQDQRLQRALARLARAQDAHLTIAEIAYATGFLSNAHFSRAFKARFGVRPGEARAGEAMGVSRRPDVAESVMTWLRDL